MVVASKFNNAQLKTWTWLLLHKTNNLVMRAGDQVFAKAGLTSQQYTVLMTMKLNKSGVTPTRVANWLDLSANTISTLSYRMEERGLIKRKRDLSDRRSVRLVMTQKGKEALAVATNSGWQVILGLFNGLPEEKLRSFAAVLDVVSGKAFNCIKRRHGATDEI